MVDGKDFKDKEVSVYDNQYQTQKDADGKTLKPRGKIFILEI
jgi:POT family proton-dependent oligopeptide transporter